MSIDDIQLPLPTPLVEHRAQIQVLAGAGIKPPAAWAKLNQRLDDYLQLHSPALTNLVNNVIHPDASDDRPTMRALALAEANTSHHTLGTVNGAVINAVLAKLREVYQPVAADIYAKAADLYDQAAKDFTGCATTVDPETPAESMVGRGEVEENAWKAAQLHVGRLTALTPVLATAASLAGLDIDPDAPDDTLLLPLVCDPADRQRRRVWESWYAEGGRCGRWASLLKTGVTLRAASLEEHQPYREPRDLQYKQEQVAPGHVRTVTIDPEDNPGALPPIDPRRRTGRVTAV